MTHKIDQYDIDDFVQATGEYPDSLDEVMDWLLDSEQLAEEKSEFVRDQKREDGNT